jgi:cytoskeleton protein RodZ
MSASAPAGSGAATPGAASAVAGVAIAPFQLPAASAAASGPEARVSAASAPASGVLRPATAPAPAASAATVESATAAQGIDEVLAHVAPAPNIPLQVVAGADSWVEVVDAHGRTLLSRTVLAGESVGLDGAMPMRIKIGNASGTHLKLRGDNVDLAPWTRDNVARLEVK